ncbi:zinc finger protein 28 [Trichonephila inaurata madagascariensis]|uniref:Zinc finger protein 28 n=1 Tax=Trichonephila inaurata madagascariensis TaxID=2747483 RepID=A0A8X6YFC2_9ARAC|nr:zinc finger protein 28 [Trichonephila inaurata madagascariensis]
MSIEESLMTPDTDEIRIDMVSDMCMPILGIHGYFFCSICGENFESKNELRKHKTSHNPPKFGEKPYACEYCPKTFTSKSLLRRHSATHANEVTDDKYGCEGCGKPFDEFESLQDHYSTCIIDKQYACEMCEKTFFNNTDLEQHFLSHGDVGALIST